MVLVVIVFIGLSRFVHEQLSAPELASLRTVLVWVLGSLTLVNLVLTGALALWMESAAGQKPVRVRFQQMLAALNHLEDGVVILDGEGRVTGVNVRARSIASATLRPHMRLGELFPFLDADQQRALLSGKETREIEAQTERDHEVHTYRLRVYPSRHVRLLFICDVTKEQEEAERREHQSEMALIGRVAQGVAHDFNNILCAILGHAELLQLSGLDPEAMTESLATICKEANRGAALARQLVDLSRPHATATDAVDVGGVIEQAVSLIGRTEAARSWEIRTDCPTPPPFTAMPAHQLEQMLIRFGFQAMDGFDAPGILHLVCRADGNTDLFGQPDRPAAMITVAACHRDESFASSALKRETEPLLARDGGGVIQSVVLSVLEQCGGKLQAMRQPNGYPAYRFLLPPVPLEPTLPSEGKDVPWPDAFRCWAILLAQPAGARKLDLAQAKSSLLWTVTQVNNIVALLDRLDRGDEFQALFLDEALLGEGPEETLQEIARKAPRMPCVVLTSDAAQTQRAAGRILSVTAPVRLSELLTALAPHVQGATSGQAIAPAP